MNKIRINVEKYNLKVKEIIEMRKPGLFLD